MTYSNLFYKPHGKKKPESKPWEKANAARNAEIRAKKTPVTLPTIKFGSEENDSPSSTINPKT